MKEEVESAESDAGHGRLSVSDAQACTEGALQGPCLTLHRRWEPMPEAGVNARQGVDCLQCVAIRR